MTKLNLSTLYDDKESLLRDLGFKPIGDKGWLAIYTNYHTVIVYSGWTITEYWWLDNDERDNFLVALLEGKRKEKFPLVNASDFKTIGQMLDHVIDG